MCEQAVSAVAILTGIGWRQYKETVHFVYLRLAGCASTIALCKRTGCASAYPNVD